MRARMPATGSNYHRSCARLITGGLLALSLCAAPAGASTLIISGAGNGHGVGMSQYGALGYAQHGYSYQAILGHYYTATALGQAPKGARVRVLVGSTVKAVPLERYVRGVVAAEMPSDWPAAALEAQAVASRTYALTAHAGGSRFDVYSDTRSQVYRGVAGETAQTNAAVAATAGQIVTYGGQPAITYFFASSGGMTENVGNVFIGSLPEPWLEGVADPYDSGPPFQWEISLSFGQAAARLSGLVKGTFRGVEVLKRGVSPRIVSAAILGTRGATLVSGPGLKARLGLEDSWAYFSVKRGSSISAEPDASGEAPAVTPPSTGPGALPASRQGGARAPGGAESALAGGTPAG